MCRWGVVWSSVSVLCTRHQPRAAACTQNGPEVNVEVDELKRLATKGNKQQGKSKHLSRKVRKYQGKSTGNQENNVGK